MAVAESSCWMDSGGNRSSSRSWCRRVSGIPYNKISDHICSKHQLKAWWDGGGRGFNIRADKVQLLKEIFYLLSSVESNYECTVHNIEARDSVVR
jgi:hypothetical protein